MAAMPSCDPILESRLPDAPAADTNALEYGPPSPEGCLAPLKLRLTLALAGEWLPLCVGESSGDSTGSTM